MIGAGRRALRRRVVGGAVLLLVAVATAAAGDDVPPSVRALASDDAAAAAEARAALVRDPAAGELVVAWLRDDERRAALSPRQIEALAGVAAERGLRAANAGLRAIVRDTALPADTRRAAIRALARTGTIADVSALGDAVAEFPEEAARALAELGGDTARAALRRNAASAEPGTASLPVLAALARMGEVDRLAAVVAALDDPQRRTSAGELLRWATGRDLPGERSVWDVHLRRALLSARLADADADAAQAATRALIDDLRRPGDRDAADDACALLADASAPTWARAKAALALGVAGRADRRDALLAATPSGTPGDVRRAAVDALARVGDLSCAVALVRGLVDDTDLDRLAAKRSVRQEFVPIDPAVVRALARWGVVGGTTVLLELLEGEYRTGLHRDALRALREVTGGDVFGYEPDASKADRDAATARARAWWREAREGLPIAPRPDDPGWPAFERDVDALVGELGQYKFLFTMRARRTLEILADPAHDRIVAGLGHANLQVRLGAAEVLENVGLRRSAAPLAGRLATEVNAAARARLLTAIESCARPDAAGTVPSADAVRPAVRAALGDRSVDVRIAAARTLGTVGDRATDPDTLRAARAEPRNAGEAFRSASAAGLLRLGDRSGLADLIAELRCDDVARRADARRVLRACGLEVAGFAPDGPPEARSRAVDAFEREQGVPPGARK